MIVVVLQSCHFIVIGLVCRVFDTSRLVAIEKAVVSVDLFCCHVLLSISISFFKVDITSLRVFNGMAGSCDLSYGILSFNKEDILFCARSFGLK